MIKNEIRNYHLKMVIRATKTLFHFGFLPLADIVIIDSKIVRYIVIDSV